MADVCKDLTGESIGPTSVRAFCDTWLAEKEKTVAPSTFEFYRKSLAKFTEWLGDKADGDITNITRAAIIEFRNHEAKTLHAKTVTHEIKCLRMLFRTAHRDGIVSTDPTAHVEAVRQKSVVSSRRPFTVDELQAVLGACDTEWRSMVLFGLYSGQRLGDVASLEWSQIDLSRGVLRLRQRKTGKALVLPLARPLLDLLGTSPGSGPVHPRAHSVVERTGKTGSLSNQFSDLLALAGLRAKASHHKQEDGSGRSGKRAPSGLTYHALRHTLTTWLEQAGVARATNQAFTGHSNDDMTQTYSHVDIAAMRKAVEELPEL
ncbi:MAG TPA: tyrosine-type recombinase/integrase [Chthoniobacterales bacterium]